MYEPVTQSTNSHSGDYAVRGEVTNFAMTNIPPTITTPEGGVPVTQNYTRFKGYYQFTNMGEDIFLVIASLWDTQGNIVAAGGGEFGATTGGYQQFIVDLDYTGGTGEVATYANLAFLIAVREDGNVDNVTEGSYFLLDDIEFDNVSFLENANHGGMPLQYALNQNLPNPFNPSTQISFSLPESQHVKLIIYNSLGQQVSTILDEGLEAGIHEIEFNAQNFPSGTYFYKIEAGEYQYVRKMLLIK